MFPFSTTPKFEAVIIMGGGVVRLKAQKLPTRLDWTERTKIKKTGQYLMLYKHTQCETTTTTRGITFLCSVMRRNSSSSIVANPPTTPTVAVAVVAAIGLGLGVVTMSKVQYGGWARNNNKITVRSEIETLYLAAARFWFCFWNEYLHHKVFKMFKF